jgi:hypothetical protein
MKVIIMVLLSLFVFQTAFAERERMRSAPRGYKRDYQHDHKQCKWRQNENTYHLESPINE